MDTNNPNRNDPGRASDTKRSAATGLDLKNGSRSTRGFASMDPDKQRAIASKGGKAAHESGNAHQFTPDEAREAGRKGGQASGSRLSRGAAKNKSAIG